MNFTDAVSVTGRPRKTADGFLVAQARCVRTGIQLYAGDEVGKPEMGIVSVYRDEREVFNRESLQSFSHAPITLDHPASGVDAESWKELSVGEVSTGAVRDGEWVQLPLILKDAQAILKVEGGKSQLSAGYTCDLDFTPGVAPNGERYDARQVGIRINHLAIVDNARAGTEARIGDGATHWGAVPVTKKDEAMPDNINLRSITFDGLTHEVTDAGAQIITKLEKQLEDAATANAAAVTAKDSEIAKLTGDLAKAEAARDAALERVLTDAALDKRVQERASLISTARAIYDQDYAGLSDLDIRKAAIKGRLGDKAIEGKSDAYVDARFDTLVEDGAADPLRTAPTQPSGVPPRPLTADAAHSKMQSDLANRWKTSAKAGA